MEPSGTSVTHNELPSGGAPLPRLNDLLVAIGALTVLPFPRPGKQTLTFGRATPLFPLVGLLIGAPMVALNGLLGIRLPPWLLAVLLVAAWEAVTFRAGVTPAATAVTVLIKIAGLTLATGARPMALLFAPTLGAWCVVVLATGARDAAAPGRKFNPAIAFREFALASGLTFAVVFAVAEAAGILIVVCIAAVTLAMRLLSHRWLGGVSWPFLLLSAQANEALVVVLCALL